MIEHLAISELIQCIDEFIAETAGKTICYDHYTHRALPQNPMPLLYK